MLSFFPQILFLAPLGITFLRIGAAIAFAVIAYRIIQSEEHIEDTSFPLIGKPASWMVWLTAIINAVIAISLFMGYATQIMALVGALSATKHLVFYKKYRAILPLSSGTYSFLILICFVLVVTGAGAFAFDLPF